MGWGGCDSRGGGGIGGKTFQNFGRGVPLKPKDQDLRFIFIILVNKSHPYLSFESKNTPNILDSMQNILQHNRRAQKT